MHVPSLHDVGRTRVDEHIGQRHDRLLEARPEIGSPCLQDHVCRVRHGTVTPGAVHRTHDGKRLVLGTIGPSRLGPRRGKVGAGRCAMIFADRVDAGRRLAARLLHLRSEPVVVLGLPRGGVPVAAEVAAALDAPLDVIVVRKLGVPFQPELGMGAIGEDGARVINEEIVRMARVSEHQLAEVEARERAELERRARRFRGDRPRVPLEGRVALVVDDGIATGSTARAACQVARAHGAARVVLAVPVAPADWTTRFVGYADELVCVDTPEPFFAIGQFYADFSQTPDDEVLACLQRARDRAPAPVAGTRAASDDPSAHDEEVTVHAGALRLGGHLTLPEGATAVVVFAHGSGSSRHSPRNRYVAAVLNDAGLGTLLFDLLTATEEHDRANVFDIELLAERLADVTRGLRTQPELGGLRIGYFGASTGAAAALWAATEPDVDVAAVVSRGGRPDLAAPRLPMVVAPTLLIVGGHDDVVLDLNRQAQAQLQRCENRLTIIPGATHLFEEPGTLQVAAEAARDWFTRHLSSTPPPAG
jgi:putative phosphoribosyl transferase